MSGLCDDEVPARRLTPLLANARKTGIIQGLDRPILLRSAITGILPTRTLPGSRRYQAFCVHHFYTSRSWFPRSGIFLTPILFYCIY